MTKEKIIREPLRCCGRRWPWRPEYRVCSSQTRPTSPTSAVEPLEGSVSNLLQRQLCAHTHTHTQTDHTKHLWLLHIEFHISDPEMCTGLCVQLEKYTIWNFCCLEKGGGVQILYAQGKSRYFPAQGWWFTHVGVGFHENDSPSELRIRFKWQTFPLLDHWDGLADTTNTTPG